jgi:hypothetical protein
MTLIDQVSGDRNTDLENYITLLRANENTTENVTALRDLMIRLNKTDEQVAIDASVIRRGDAQRANIQSGLTATMNLNRQTRDVFDEDTEVQWKAFLAAQEAARVQWKADRAAEREPVEAAYDAAVTAHRTAVDSIAAFNDLKRQNPDLFVDQALKSAADIA